MRHALSLLLFVVTATSTLSLPMSAAAQSAADPNKGTILLTIFLRHDQSKTLDEINAQLAKNRYYEKFPPKGVEIVSWYIAMGVGQVVTLRLPAEQLRAVNRSIEESAWGAYRTEFYATYDFKPIWEAMPKPNR
jgi:hypothetical protein